MTQVYIGIDWSERKHDVCVTNPAGAVLARLTLPHSPAGFAQLEALRQQLQVPAAACVVALETAQNLLIDYLWEHDYQQIYVVPPHVVKSVRGRYGQSQAHTDASDSFLLADLLRTDRARLRPWHPDSVPTRQLRAFVSLDLYLLHERLQLANRLRAVLLRYYPAALEVFSALHSLVALRFIERYPTPAQASALTLPAFQAFAAEVGYRRPDQLRKRFARLQRPQPQPTVATVAVYQSEAVCLARLLLGVVQARTALVQQARDVFRQHPDAHIFASLPGAGAHLAPALLALFGDDRARFPSAAGVQALAGTCPVTWQSGQGRRVHFRRACDHHFRQVVQQWARLSRRQSSWARAYWEQVRPRCASDAHADRCLANRWLAIAWKLWSTRQPYDEAYHLRQRALRSQPRAQA
jgi:transposase